MDLFIGMFNEDDRQIVLDLRKPLRQFQGAPLVYYRTDTHWNAYGAYIAYQEILKNASQTNPDLLPVNLNEFEFSESPPQTLDLARLLGGDFLQEPRIVFQPKFVSDTYFYRIPPLSNISISSSDLGTRKLLIYHDSFGDALNSFMQYSFKDAVYIRNAITDNDPFVSTWVNTFKPDVIVIEVVERNMAYLDLLLSKLLTAEKP